jgi:hypothetical protein
MVLPLALTREEAGAVILGNTEQALELLVRLRAGIHKLERQVALPTKKKPIEATFLRRSRRQTQSQAAGKTEHTQIAY